MGLSEVYLFENLNKPKKEKFKNDSFPIATWENIGRRWTLLILKDFKAKNFLRFSDFKRFHPKLSNAVLSHRLEKLRKLGLIDKKASFEDNLLIEYQLTESGIELIQFFDAFSLWALNLKKNKIH